MTFEAHKLVRSEPFLDNKCDIWQLLSALCGDIWKVFYTGAHLRSRPYTAAVEFYSNVSAIYTKWDAQTFSPIFGLFTIFDHNFTKIVASTNDDNKNSLVHLPNKRWKQHQNRPPKPWHNTCSNYVHHAQVDQMWQTKNTIFSHLQSERVVRSPQTLHGDKGRQDHQKGGNHFSIQRTVKNTLFYRGENAGFWPLTHWVNLIPAGCHGNLPVTRSIRRVQTSTKRADHATATNPQWWNSIKMFLGPNHDPDQQEN